VVGRDAVTFMNRLYVNAWTGLAVALPLWAAA